MLLLGSARKEAGTRKNFPYSLPAPVGGMNASTSPTQMAPWDAFRITGFQPYADRVDVRGAFSYHKTGSANAVTGLHAYYGLAGTNTLWATTASGVYDVTGAGAWPAASIALTDGKTIGSILSTGAASYLTLVNGVDNAVQYNGAAWAAIAAFGAVASNTLSYVETYRQRLYFIIKDTLDVFYLAANAVAGVGTTYTFSSIFRRGGKLVALATWTIDGGAGPDDNIVLVTSQGEAAVFSGNDPATWTLKGVYFIGRPLSRKPLIKFGGDLLYLCELGVFPLSKALQSATINRTLAVSNKIATVFQAAVGSSATSLDWEFEIATPFLYIYIPTLNFVTAAGLFITGIFVMNLDTGAWTQLFDCRPGNTGAQQQYFCLRQFNGTLYLGGTRSGTHSVDVYGARLAIDYADSNRPVFGEFYQAPNLLGYPREKKIEQITPQFFFSGSSGGDTVSVSMGVVSDFNFSLVNLPPSLSTIGFTTGGLPSVYYRRGRYSAPDVYGQWKSLYMKVSGTQTLNQYFGSALLAKPGGSY